VLYERGVRPLLFRAARGDAETVHQRTLAGLARLARHPVALAAVARVYGADEPTLARTVFGVRFPHPVGLAAGMDKDGVALRAWPAFGFGFVEVGTVTRHAQPGNPRPRLLRLPDSGAIVNRMGFNNAGAPALAARLAALGPLPVPLGISLGRSKVTPEDEAVADYAESLRLLHHCADYVAVNVSSPNTPGLRSLQERDRLAELVGALAAEASALASAPGGPRHPSRSGPVPLLVKIAPDLSDTAVGEVLQVCADAGVSGVIATNTTLGRSGLAPADTALGAAEAGGLSGRPLAERALEVVRLVVRETGGRLPVVGVGGVRDADGARRLLDAGASLLQVYTGLVYRGPGLAREIVRGLAADAVGEGAGSRAPAGAGRAGSRAGVGGGRQEVAG